MWFLFFFSGVVLPRFLYFGMWDPIWTGHSWRFGTWRQSRGYLV